jgi:RNA polymerase sigma factor (TIGR02999 family)
MSSPGAPITLLLRQAREGSSAAAAQLAPLVYDQLRRLAQSYLRSEQGQTLAATALVHEAYIRLAGSDVEWRDRVHFFAMAARQMRRILIDHARARQSDKRGAGAERVPLEEVTLVTPERSVDVIDVDSALNRLASFDSRKAEVIELLYFGGMTVEETSEAIGISTATVERELRVAKAWLQAELARCLPPA